MVWLLWVYTTWVVGPAADQLALADPEAVARGPASAMILGGAGLFLAGHAAFKAVIWRRVSWPRLGALAVLGLLGLAAPHVTALALGACTAVVIVAVAVLDYARNRRLPGEAAGRATPAPAPAPEDPRSSAPRTPTPGSHLRT
jgi:low temperature requirement protein LtrA